MELNIIILLLVCHWIGDFVFQTTEMAINKNHSLGHLFYHVSLYSFIMFLGVLIYSIITAGVTEMGTIKIFYFWLITFITHGIVDYFSSKKTHKLHEKNKYYTSIPNFGFFSIIGLDQVVHLIILFGTYVILF
jgi:hypothetical protein